MAAFTILKLSLLVTLFFFSSALSMSKFPPSCSRIECPGYIAIHSGNGYEIRLYNSTVWMSTSPIQDVSLVEATRDGFLQLFEYIQGKNNYRQEIEMTAPVISKISPSDGPFCMSSFTVSFYVPKENQANPPPAKGLHVQQWKATHMAVKQFSGFVTDSDVAVEAASLQASLTGTAWADAISKSHATSSPTTVYTVAQYNSPFEYDNRVNEIWMKFDMEDAHAI